MAQIEIFIGEKFDMEATEDGSKYDDSALFFKNDLNSLIFRMLRISFTRSKTKANLEVLEVV